MKNYQKPDATYIELSTQENITVELGTSDNQFDFDDPEEE